MAVIKKTSAFLRYCCFTCINRACIHSRAYTCICEYIYVRTCGAAVYSPEFIFSQELINECSKLFCSCVAVITIIRDKCCIHLHIIPVYPLLKPKGNIVMFLPIQLNRDNEWEMNENESVIKKKCYGSIQRFMDYYGNLPLKEMYKYKYQHFCRCIVL